MFIGHFAPALLARGITEDAPKLGVLFIAAQLVDWVFFTFAIFGIEQLRIVPGITAMNPLDLVFMPYSHSLLATAGWALVFGVVVGIVLRNIVAAAWGALWGQEHRPRADHQGQHGRLQNHRTVRACHCCRLACNPEPAGRPGSLFPAFAGRKAHLAIWPRGGRSLVLKRRVEPQRREVGKGLAGPGLA